MDRTAPTILPLNLNHVIGTAAARFSVDIRSADQTSADDRILFAAGKVAEPSRRAVDGARIPFFKVEMTTALTACSVVGTVLRSILRPAPAVEKAGAKPGHGPNKGEGK